MPDLKTIGAPKSLSLSDLNKAVSQNEAQLGPLTGIGNDGNQTLLTFDMDPDPPAKYAIIAAAVGNPPSGSTTVCKGTVFVAGTLTAAIATRPN